MKRASTFFTASLIICLSLSQYASAQDDVYYDPNKDKGAQSAPPAEQPPAPYEENDNSQQQQPADKSDGYGSNNDNPAYKYDAPQNSESYQKDGNTYITNNYYEDDDAYPYTTHLRRYYAPNYGVNFYSYWFTPSFYLGWNAWNGAYTVSVNPWYSDPWWGWNRRHHRVVVYDPYYDPYWDWNFGWNSCSYYNSWNDPYWGNSFCSYPGYGYSGYGYGGGGYCGGGYGYGGYGGHGGYYNGYNHGYRDGYYNGYGDANWNNTSYNNVYYYNGPRKHKSLTDKLPSSNPSGPTSTSNPPNPKSPGEDRAPLDRNNINIPREGIQKPLPADRAGKAVNNGVSIESNTPPYKSTERNVTGKSRIGSGDEKMNSDKRGNQYNGIAQPVEPGINERHSGNAGNTFGEPKSGRPKPQEQYVPEQKLRNDRWREETPDPRTNRAPDENRQPQPRQNNDYRQPNNSVPREEPRQEMRQVPLREMRQEPPQQMRQEPQPQQRQENINRIQPERNNEQPRMAPRQNEVPRSNPEPRNYAPQPRSEPRNFQQPRSNMQESAPRQNNFAPSHGGGNGRGRH